MHAARLHHPDQERARLAGGHERHRDRPLQPGRPPAGAIAAQRECDGDDRAFALEGSAATLRPRRSGLCRRRQAGDGARRLDQAGRHRDRRRHQPHAIARRQDPAGRRRRLQGSGRGRRRDHAGARRRRADDGGVPAWSTRCARRARSTGCRSRGCDLCSSPVFRAKRATVLSARRDGSLRSPQCEETLTPPRSRSAGDRTGSCRHSPRQRGVRWCRGSASDLPNWRAPARSGKSCR